MTPLDRRAGTSGHSVLTSAWLDRCFGRKGPLRCFSCVTVAPRSRLRGHLGRFPLAMREKGAPEWARYFADMSQENVEQVREAYEAFARGDLDGVLDSMDPE